MYCILLSNKPPTEHQGLLKNVIQRPIVLFFFLRHGLLAQTSTPNSDRNIPYVFKTPPTNKHWKRIHWSFWDTIYKKKEWKEEYITNAAAAARTDSHVGLFGHSRCCCVTWTVPECKDHSPVTKDRLQGLSSLQIFCKVELGFQPSILRAAHCAKVHPGFTALWKLLSILKGSKLNCHPTHPGPI